EVRGVEEADPDLLDQPAALVGRQLDGDAEGLEGVGAAGAGRDRPAAVLRHRDAGGGGQDGVGRADVEGGEAAAGAAHVGEVALDLGLDLDAVGPHGPGDGRHLV